MNKQRIPLPKIGPSEGYEKGRRRRVYRYRLYIKFPCIPAIGYTLSAETHGKIIGLLHGKDSGQTPINWGTRLKPRIVGHVRQIKDQEASDLILKTFFGKTTKQTFYRIVKSRNRVVSRNNRSMWCVPRPDIAKVFHRYRGNTWNESEIVPKEYQWLFEPLHQQLLKFYEEGGLSKDFKPDYSVFDVGEDRKPLLYKCNLCSFEGEKDAFQWGAPVPGFASHQIIRCLQCKKDVWSDDADPFTDMFTFGAEKAPAFAPTFRYQDEWWLSI